MARYLHTHVADALRAEAWDAENLRERQMESVEYANEVRGLYDWDDDPADYDPRDDAYYDYDDSHLDYCAECGEPKAEDGVCLCTDAEEETPPWQNVTTPETKTS